MQNEQILLRFLFLSSTKYFEEKINLWTFNKFIDMLKLYKDDIIFIYTTHYITKIASHVYLKLNITRGSNYWQSIASKLDMRSWGVGLDTCQKSRSSMN